MAQDDNAVLVAAKGYVFTAPEGSNGPTPTEVGSFDPAAGLTTTADDGTTTINWDNIGHTSREDLPEFGYEGGDTETLGTWQASTLREVITEPASDYVTFNLHQFDQAALELYYGTTGGSTEGVFDVSDSSVSTTKKALTIIIVDGDVNIAFYAPNTSIRREDAVGIATDSLGFLPLRGTFLKVTGDPLFSWISDDIAVNTVA